MRSSSGGWVENRAIQPGPPAIPEAAMLLRQRLGVKAAQAAQRILHRQRRAHQLRCTRIGPEFTLAREPGDDNAGQHTEDDFADHAGDHVADARGRCFPRRDAGMSRPGNQRPATGRRRRCSLRPGSSVSVTMSPLAMWATSCARTASASSRVMLCNSPVDTATRELFLVAPVAKALGSPS
jgi:hypothetical protein